MILIMLASTNPQLYYHDLITLSSVINCKRRNKYSMNRKTKKSGISRLIELAGEKKLLILIGCILGAVATVLQFFPAILSYLSIIEVVEGLYTTGIINAMYIRKLALISLGCFIAYGILFYFGSMCTHVAAFDILYSLRIRIAEKLSKLGMGYFLTNSTGSIKQVMNDDVENIEKFIAHHTVDIVSAISVLVLSFTAMCFIDIRLTIAGLIPTLIGIYLYVKSYSSTKNKKLTEDYYREIAAMSGTTVEYANGMSVLKIFGQTGASLKRLETHIHAHNKALKAWGRAFTTPISGFSTAISSPLTLIIPVGVLISLQTSELSTFLPRFFFFLLVGASMNLPLSKLMFLVSMLQKNVEGLRHIDNILNAQEIADPIMPQTPQDNSITFKNVCFSYGEEEVLHNISFAIAPGETVGLVGPSGGGKSTIAQLIARFWDIQQGDILIGGKNIKELSAQKLMETVSFVFQDIYMFRDTIENNIRMGSNASHEKVIAAAKAAQAHDFICRLPKGYDTVLGEDTAHLSGGEQQRISIARAILKDAPILILDEATAYADAENEAKIQDAFSELTKGKTVLVIAHRLSTITGADKILVVEDGYLKETGVHNELVAHQGLYARLYTAYTRSQHWALKTAVKEVQ